MGSVRRALQRNRHESFPMSLLPKFLRYVSFAFVSLALATAAWASDAKVIKKVGSGEASYTPNGAAKVKIDGAGVIIPEKSLVETGPGVELFVETFSGAVVTVRQNSRLLIEELNAGTRRARLNLRSGQVVSTLDPAQRDRTDYSIATPTGVAAARGTVFSVTVIPTTGGGANTSVATLSGIVRIDRGPGVPPLDVPYGQGSVNSAAAQALAALAASDPTVATDIVAAVRTVADNVAAATSAAGSSNDATNELVAVVSAATAAVPTQAGAIVQSAVAGAAAPGSSMAGQRSTLNAVSAITEAAVQAVATSNPGQIANITQGAAAAVTSSASSTGGSDANLAAAVAAVTTAAVKVAPNQAAAAAQGAAQGVVSTKVGEAVAAASAANPSLTPAQLALIGNTAANSSSAAAAVSIVATSATTTAIAATGQSGNPGAANAIGQAVASGTNTGSNNGAQGGTGTGPQVSVGIAQGTGSLTVNATASTPTGTASTSTQTLTGNQLSPISTTTTGAQGASTTTTNPTGETILPPLDQVQPVLSPSRP